MLPRWVLLPAMAVVVESLAPNFLLFHADVRVHPHGDLPAPAHARVVLTPLPVHLPTAPPSPRRFSSCVHLTLAARISGLEIWLVTAIQSAGHLHSIPWLLRDCALHHSTAPALSARQAGQDCSRGG